MFRTCRSRNRPPPLAFRLYIKAESFICLALAQVSRAFRSLSERLTLAATTSLPSHHNGREATVYVQASRPKTVAAVSGGF